jgi:Putative transposase
VLTLSGEEFLRRWVQHVLPRGFVKVRHYGLLSSHGREENLPACRWQLWLSGLAAAAARERASWWPGPCCPECGSLSWQKGAEVLAGGWSYRTHREGCAVPWDVRPGRSGRQERRGAAGARRPGKGAEAG